MRSSTALPGILGGFQIPIALRVPAALWPPGKREAEPIGWIVGVHMIDETRGPFMGLFHFYGLSKSRALTEAFLMVLRDYPFALHRFHAVAPLYPPARESWIDRTRRRLRAWAYWRR